MRQPADPGFPPDRPDGRTDGRTAAFALLLGGVLVVTSMMENPASAQECPAGFRLHYQGFCINKADELADDPVKGIRTVEPTHSLKESRTAIFEQLAKTGYKFSNMEDGEYCKNAYIRISRSEITHPVAFALGDQSCGFSDEKLASLEAAKAHAMAACEKHTGNCRIIFPEYSD